MEQILEHKGGVYLKKYVLENSSLQKDHNATTDDELFLNMDILKTDAESHIITIVNYILVKGITNLASDIHIEPLEDYIRVRFRTDGVLKNKFRLPIKAFPPLVSRLKIMADMDIAEKRLPQDGRIQIEIENKKVDLRVSSLPTIFGEKLVLRILNQDQRILSIEELGLEEKQFSKFKSLLKYPHGMILVTGPTGSGKTTTLYAALNQIRNKDLQNIVTIEDPVEYILNGINQVQTNSKSGLNFSKGLRSILRQDPDVIMIGEIRDKETAEIAVRAATTGHLVLSTLHTNDAAGSLTRLIEMGIDSYFVASAVIGVIAQRLVRRICPKCKVDYEITSSCKETLLIDNYNDRPKEDHKVILSKGKGCAYCSYTGYKGRIIILEILQVDDQIRKGILNKLDAVSLRNYGINNNMLTLKQDGINKVLQGITTIDEIIRVTYDGEI